REARKPVNSPARSRHCDRSPPLAGNRKSDLPSRLETRHGALDPKEIGIDRTAVRPASPPIAIPVREILPWLIFGALMLLLLYFVGIEEGAISIIPGMSVN